MKKYKRKIIVVGILGVIVFVIGIFFFQSSKPTEWAGGDVTPENWQSFVKQVSPQEASRTLSKKTDEDFFFEWRLPIRFYGKAINQFGEPVEGAKVEMRWTDLSPKEESQRIIYTDSHGKFSLEGVRGKRLFVNMNKEGYYEGINNPDNKYSFEYVAPYEYCYIQPDPNSPVIFKMRKKGAPTSLITGKAILQLPGQDARGGMDFLASKYMEVSRTYLFGKAVPTGEGQMQVTTSRPIYTAEYRNTGGKTVPYDWSIDIKFPDGGFIETDEIFPFLAPESGYQSTYSQKSHIEDAWSKERDFRKQWYFRIGNPPQYGLMKIYAYGAGDKVSIKYLLNPTAGDRNLEPLEKEYREWK